MKKLEELLKEIYKELVNEKIKDTTDSVLARLKKKIRTFPNPT